MKPSIRRWWLPLNLAMIALASLALLLPSCAWDGHFSVLGYSTQPNYDSEIRTVSVPIFKNRTYWTATPNPGMEMDLTRAVIREIEARTPFKVKQCDADTELKGVIVAFQKTLINYTPLNTVREAETAMTCRIVWKNLRTGKYYTRPIRRPGQMPDPDPRQPLVQNDSVLPPGGPGRSVAVPSAPTNATSGAVESGIDDDVFVDPANPLKINFITLRTTAHYRPELGESITTSMQKNINRMAAQIVQAMEKPW